MAGRRAVDRAKNGVAGNYRLHSRPPVDIQVDGESPYAANLCPLSVWVEVAGFRENFGESIGELIETMLRNAVRQRTPEHLDGMLGE